MISTTVEVEGQLVNAGYAVGSMKTTIGNVTTFENDTILGFVIYYQTVDELLQKWQTEGDIVLQSAQFSLRRAGTKAWNTYLVYLADAQGEYGQQIRLGSIEEDLVGTRKIARSGLSESLDYRSALLPLLPLQNAPQLEAVDMPSEIRLRTTELPPELLDTFLSGASETTLFLMLESEP